LSKVQLSVDARMPPGRLLLAVSAILLMLVCFALFFRISFLNEQKTINFHSSVGQSATTQDWTPASGRLCCGFGHDPALHVSARLSTEQWHPM